MIDEIKFTLNSPLTQEDWNKITDAEFEHSDTIYFSTPSNKEVEFKKVTQGEWIEDDDARIRGHCSVCKWEAHYYEDDVVGMNYCPNCGARMELRGEEE